MVTPKLYHSLSPTERRKLRQDYIKSQEGLCAYCNRSIYEAPTMDKEINWGLFPKGFLNYPIHLDHDHETGYTRGAVHAYCNAVLWQYHGK